MMNDNTDISFEKWEETAKVINTMNFGAMHQGGVRTIYKTPNSTFLCHDVWMPVCGFKLQDERAYPDWNILKTPDNIALLESMGGYIDSDIAYTTEDRGTPVLKTLESAYNFAQTMKDTLIINSKKEKS